MSDDLHKEGKGEIFLILIAGGEESFYYTHIYIEKKKIKKN